MDHIRPAGANERRCIVRDVFGLYGYIAATATHEGPMIPEKSMIYEILKTCIDRHPMLSTIVQAADSKQPQLSRARILDLDKHLRYLQLREETGLRDLLLQIHNEPQLEYEAFPQWRVWIFSNVQDPHAKASFQVAFACSHALADGMSLYAFHRSFQKALCHLKDVRSSSGAIYEVERTNDLLPSLESVVKMPISWSLLVPRLIAEFAPAVITKMLSLDGDNDENIWCGAGKRPDLPAKGQLLTTALETLIVPHLTLQKALRACRNHGGRLTALIDHLATRALAAALTGRGQDYSQFGIEISINLRKVIPQGHNEIANYPTAIEQKHDITANPDPAAPLGPADWETIRRNTAELAEMANRLNDQPIALLRYVTDFQRLVMSRATSATSTAFGMSNLGTFIDDRESKQDWRMTEMVFSQSADATSAIFNINVANVTNGPLAITLTWWPRMLGVDDEQQFARDVLNGIADQLEAML